MAYVEKILNGLKVISEIESSMFKLMTKTKQTFYQLHMEFRKFQYWDHFFSFFHYFVTKWKLNKISFILVFWYFIKEITLCDVEYSLNFHKNPQNADVSKKSRDKP